MFDHALGRAAFHTRAAGLVVATTGSATLAATAAGYTRASGSFITDGFVVGMEVTPTGFTQTTPGVVAAVAATLLTIIGGRTAQASGSGRALTVSLPEVRPIVNGQAVKPDINRPYLTEKLVPGGNVVTTFPAKTGRMVETGLFVFQWAFVGNLGPDAIDACVVALKRRFTPATELSLSDGSAVRMRGDVAVTNSEPIPVDSGHAVVTITVPWIVRTSNAVAA